MRLELAFGQKKWAVVGANNNPEKFGNKVYKMLKNAGFVVYPVNGRYDEVDGDRCYKSLDELPEKVDYVSVVVRPDIAEEYVKDYDAVFWFQPNTYTEETLKKVGSGKYIAGPCVLVEHGKKTERIERIRDNYVKWLKDKLAETHAKGFMIGISGGVDSALVAALIKQAAPSNSMGLIMPCYSSEEDVAHGKMVAEQIGIEHRVVDIAPAHRSIMDALSFDNGLGKEAALRSSDSNLRARLRMAALYAEANYRNYLVVGTDNAAELLIGYFTKYGDGGVDLILPGALLKCEVYHMARVMGLPKEVIYKAPSAGLWQGQTDEGEIGLSYDIIDSYILGEDVGPDARAKIERMHLVSEHKRNVPPQPDESLIPPRS